VRHHLWRDRARLPLSPFKHLKALKNAAFSQRFPHAAHRLHTVFHSFYTQDIVVDMRE
jgi:hypothetical protein